MNAALDKRLKILELKADYNSEKTVAWSAWVVAIISIIMQQWLVAIIPSILFIRGAIELYDIASKIERLRL